MKGIIILAVLASVAIASPALNVTHNSKNNIFSLAIIFLFKHTQQVCEQKNEVLGNALQNFAIKNIPKDLRAGTMHILIT